MHASNISTRDFAGREARSNVRTTMTNLLRLLLLAVVAIGCQNASRATPPSGQPEAGDGVQSPAEVHTFAITFSSHEEGVVLGPTTTIRARSSGELSVSVPSGTRTRTLDPGELATLRGLVADRALLATHSVPAAGEGRISSLRIDGDVHLDVSFYNAIPASAGTLVAELERLARATPAAPTTFQVTITRQEHGGRLGPRLRVTAGSDGQALITADGKPDVHVSLPPAALAQLASLLAVPALAAVASTDLRGEGVQVTLEVTGDVSVHASFAEPVPAAAGPVIQMLEELAAHPPQPPVFSVTLTTQMFGVAVGPKHTVTASSDGTIAIADANQQVVRGTLTPAQVSAIAGLLADPALAAATSSPMRGEGVQITIEASGVATVKLHYQARSGAAAADALVRELDGIAHRVVTAATGGALGERCAGIDNGRCSTGLVCDVQTCGKDAAGTCVQAPPKVCGDEGEEQCGCDGKRYPSDCERVRAGIARSRDKTCLQ